MHRQRFAEGAGLAHKHAAALAQGTVECFDDARAAVAFWAAAVLPTGQHVHVGREQVREVPATAPVAAGQRLPQVPGRGRVAAA